MPFPTLSADEARFLEQQAALPAQIVGLSFPVLIDRRIEALIRSRWNDDTKKQMLSNLFRNDGALGSFGTRVQIGYAISLYDEEMYKDIRRIVKIRNAFAHKLGVDSFDDPLIRGFTKSLKLIERRSAVFLRINLLPGTPTGSQ